MRTVKRRLLAVNKRTKALQLLILILTTGLWTIVPEAQTPHDYRGHQFTVNDLIGISNFLTPTPIWSPDAQHFLLVTQRGILSTNKIEGTLWVFDRRSVFNYLNHKSAVSPSPRLLARFRAKSNTPVISDVRWLADSQRVAFLAKAGGINQRLFIANLRTGAQEQITRANTYVTGYDVSEDTIAYSTLITPRDNKDSNDDYVDVMGKSLISLLSPRPIEVQDLDEASIGLYGSLIHVVRNSRELTTSFRTTHKPLVLFAPTLSLSPDGKTLITVAPVHEIPHDWELYRPWVDRDSQRLKPGTNFYLSGTNSRRAEEYVMINLDTGVVSPLVNAPAGRVLQYLAPTKSFWLADSRQVILTNTFLPFGNEGEDQKQKDPRALSPAVVLVNVSTHKSQIITYLRQDPIDAKAGYTVSNVSWDRVTNVLNVTYKGWGDKASVPLAESYGLAAGAWSKLPLQITYAKPGADQQMSLSIDEDLNHSPTLSGYLFNHSAMEVIWNPNPQLAYLRTGKVYLYNWSDESGRPWAGIVALPPDYDPKMKYPLVIQTHGYREEDKKYFADGEYTTGNAGRALAAHGLIVLQMEVPLDNLDTPTEAPEQLSGFEAAIMQLTADGSVDPHRVGIIGFSRTCFHVLYAITHRPDLFAAASITDGFGMSYMEYLTLTDIPLAQEEFIRVNGQMPFGDGLGAWLKNAPGFSLDKVKTPLLLSGFERGSLLGEWEIYSGLRILGKPVDMVWLRKENAPHVLVEPYQRYVSQQMAVDWFDFWLNDHENRAVGKGDEYARWRKLRALIQAN